MFGCEADTNTTEEIRGWIRGKIDTSLQEKVKCDQFMFCQNDQCNHVIHPNPKKMNIWYKSSIPIIIFCLHDIEMLYKMHYVIIFGIYYLRRDEMTPRVQTIDQRKKL